jgi:hypothetical protein
VKWTSILPLFLCLFFAFEGYVFASTPEVLSYASWKKQRVGQAKLVHNQLLELRRSKLNLTREEELRLRRARMKLLMMEELTPSDYLQQYLIRNYPNNFQVLEKAAAKMKPVEVAEIMRAYANLVRQRSEVQPPPSAPPLFPNPDFTGR